MYIQLSKTARSIECMLFGLLFFFLPMSRCNCCICVSRWGEITRTRDWLHWLINTRVMRVCFMWYYEYNECYIYYKIYSLMTSHWVMAFWLMVPSMGPHAYEQSMSEILVNKQPYIVYTNACVLLGYGDMFYWDMKIFESLKQVCVVCSIKEH